MKILFRCTVKFGHVGSGRFVERYLWVRARNASEALNKAKRFPGVKKGQHYRSGRSVLEVVRA